MEQYAETLKSAVLALQRLDTETSRVRAEAAAHGDIHALRIRLGTCKRDLTVIEASLPAFDAGITSMGESEARKETSRAELRADFKKYEGLIQSGTLHDAELAHAKQTLEELRASLAAMEARAGESRKAIRDLAGVVAFVHRYTDEVKQKIAAAEQRIGS